MRCNILSIETKHNYYQDKLRGTSFILCKESAAEYLNLSNVNLDYNIDYYEDGADVEFIEILGIRCTTVNQTINDLLTDPECNEQVLLEALSNYYYEHKESFAGEDFENKNYLVYG